MAKDQRFLGSEEFVEEVQERLGERDWFKAKKCLLFRHIHKKFNMLDGSDAGNHDGKPCFSFLNPILRKERPGCGRLNIGFPSE